MFDRRSRVTYLVGVRTSANIPYGSFESAWRMGTANATVLPCPVLALPTQSFPLAVEGHESSSSFNMQMIVPANSLGIHAR